MKVWQNMYKECESNRNGRRVQGRSMIASRPGSGPYLVYIGERQVGRCDKTGVCMDYESRK